MDTQEDRFISSLMHTLEQNRIEQSNAYNRTEQNRTHSSDFYTKPFLKSQNYIFETKMTIQTIIPYEVTEKYSIFADKYIPG